MTNIHLLRHGKVDGPAALYGHTDISVSSEINSRIVDQFNQHCCVANISLKKIISSPLIRCQALAKLINQRQEKLSQLLIDSAFKEINFGHYDGVPFDNIYQDNEQWKLLEKFWSTPFQYPLPDAELLTDFAYRVNQAWQSLINSIDGYQQDVLLVCHGGVIRTILANVLNIDYRNANWYTELTIPYASLSSIEVDTQGCRVVEVAKPLLPVGDYQQQSNAKLNIVIPVTPRMSEYSDFDALRLHSDVNLQFIRGSGSVSVELPHADLIILAGSNNIRADLAFIRAQGWHQQINKHLRYGGKVFGICGGYQMLGDIIDDPDGIEGKVGQSEGLGLMPISTCLFPDKTLKNIEAELNLNGVRTKVCGYEIDIGQSDIDDSLTPLLTINGRPSGAISNDGQVAGCYLHGIFDSGNSIIQLSKWCGISVNHPSDFKEL